MIGYRKFTLAMCFFFISLLLLLFKVISGELWITHNTTVVVAFIAGNLSERLINVAKTYVDDKMLRGFNKDT